jgi:DNA-binding transcriptional LysR family regulator
VPLGDLAGEQRIVPGASACCTALDDACRRAGFASDVVSATNNCQAMIGLVEAGAGIAIVPRLVAGLAHGHAVRLLPLTGTRLVRRVDVVDRAGGARTPAMDCLRQILAEQLRKLLAPQDPVTPARLAPAEMVPD